MPLPAELSLDFAFDEPTDEVHMRARVARAVGIAVDELPPVALRKRSIDARHGVVRFHLLLEIGADVAKVLGYKVGDPIIVA
ncbi:MAG: hypothetical protein ABI134_24540, partial [Byssovorax sp.]